MLPDSEIAQSLAKSFWDMAMEFANGDMSILTRLVKLKNINENGNRWEKKQAIINAYIEKALDIYFTRIGSDPITETSE